MLLTKKTYTVVHKICITTTVEAEDEHDAEMIAREAIYWKLREISDRDILDIQTSINLDDLEENA